MLDRLRLAASFLTIIPVLDSRAYPENDVAASFGWFPLIGFAIGALLIGEDYLLNAILGSAARAVLLVGTVLILTGALHLDALADAADALGARRDRERALAIMRDSRVGTFGAVAIFFVLLLEVSAIAGASRAELHRALFLSMGLSRWAMVAVADGLPYLRMSGAGTALLEGHDKGQLRIASLLAVGGALCVGVRAATIGIVIALLMTLGLRWFYRHWLDGITGDLIGAAGQLVEVAVMVIIAQ